MPTMRTAQVDLDLETLKALASKNRLYILQVLKIRSTNLTNLSKMLGLPKSSAHKDLAILVDSGLVSKIRTHRKWHTYELSAKGELLLSDESKLIALSSKISNSVIQITLKSDGAHSNSSTPCRSNLSRVPPSRKGF